jgi:hypothetical protein
LYILFRIMNSSTFHAPTEDIKRDISHIGQHSPIRL